MEGFTPLTGILEMPVVDLFDGSLIGAPKLGEDGKPSGVWGQVLNNPPALRYCPDVKIIAADLNQWWAKKKRTWQESGTKSWEKSLYAELKSFLRDPYEWRGDSYMLDKIWGSSIKDKKLLGVTDDVLVRMGLQKYAQDSVRGKRTLYCNARFGSAVLVKPRIKLLDMGEMWPIPGSPYGGLRMGDGNDIISLSLLNKIRAGAPSLVDVIEFDTPKSNYQIWQRFDYYQIAESLIEQANRQADELCDVMGFLKLVQDGNPMIRELIELDETMRKHPFGQSCLSSQIVPWMRTISYALQFPALTKVVIPSPDDKFWSLTAEPGEPYILPRFPVDSDQNIMPCEFDAMTPDQKDFWEQVSFIDQHTICGPQIVDKGTSIVVPDEWMQGYDIIMSRENIKMTREDKSKVLQRNVYVPDELVYSITQLWTGNQFVAVPLDRQKEASCDVDGDTTQETLVTRQIWNAAKAMTGQGSHKLKKGHASLDKRLTVLVSSMENVVGMIVNQNSGSFAIPHYARESLAPHWPVCDVDEHGQVRILRQCETVEEMDNAANFLIHVGTDGPKAGTNMTPIWLLARNIQSGQNQVIVKAPGHTHWKNSPWAFHHGLPFFQSEWPKMIADMAITREGRRQREYLDSVMTVSDGTTVAEIYRIVRQRLVRFFTDELDGENIYADGIDTLPLSWFVNWAPMVTQEQMELAMEFQKKWLAHNRFLDQNRERFDVEEEDQADEWRDSVAIWRAMCDQWAKVHFGGNRTIAAYALWRANHHSRSANVVAGAVFYGFPDICKHIIRDKPGRKADGSQIKAILLGLYMNFETDPDTIAPFEATVAVGNIKGRPALILYSKERLSGQCSDELIVGTIASPSRLQESQGNSLPDEGDYLVRVNRRGDNKAWEAWMSHI